jgi:uncharacterized protein YjbI with pentapeptide repeats
MSEANILVADLNGAILNGANLCGAHNLTIDQLNSARYDNQTQVEIDAEITLPRVEQVGLTNLKPNPDTVEVDKTIPISRFTSNGRAKAN